MTVSKDGLIVWYSISLLEYICLFFVVWLFVYLESKLFCYIAIW